MIDGVGIECVCVCVEGGGGGGGINTCTWLESSYMHVE